MKKLVIRKKSKLTRTSSKRTVISVIPGIIADCLGLQAGDFIIWEFDGDVLQVKKHIENKEN